MRIEVVVYNLQSALNAQAGQADRLELCSNPAEGGTTPSWGFIDVVRKLTTIDLRVMMRPRGGDFVYSRDEFSMMKRDVEQCKRLGVDGVVTGILNLDGTLDKARCKEFVDMAKPLGVTCHRAFDYTPDVFQTLEDCIEVGFDTVLTSGGAIDANAGAETLAALMKKAQGRIHIMPGGGVNEKTVEHIVRTVRPAYIHFSASEFVPSPMSVHLAPAKGLSELDGFTLRTTVAERVMHIRKMAESALL